MFGKIAVEKELGIMRIAAKEVIAEKLLVCESAIEYGETLGAIALARELGLINDKEKKSYEEDAYNKHYTFVKFKEAERKRRAAEYKAERIAKAEAAKNSAEQKG